MMRVPGMLKQSGATGFTLVEMLVVIFIISILAGLITPAVFMARRSSDRKVCRQEITRLCLAVENFADQDKLADWPPDALDKLGIAGANSINAGNECLVLCLATERGDGPYFDFDPERLKNRDEDSGPEEVLRQQLRIPFKDLSLMEYVDIWDNPYVYLPFRAYGRSAAYCDAEGMAVDCQLAKHEKTGTWPAPLKFVIWSFGPNGRNENGGGDDIVSWD